MRRGWLTTSLAVPVLASAALTPWALRVAFAQAPPPASETQEDNIPADDLPSTDPAPSDAATPEPAGGTALDGGAPGRDGMIRVPGATFTMGSSDSKSPPNERPRHVETVAPFWIDRTEVTVLAYRSCVDSHACVRPAKSSASCTYDLGDPRLPVSCVHWRDAEAFCRDLGKRLPREAEWELAGRGARSGRWPWLGGSAGCYFASTLVSETTARTCTRGPSRVGAHAAGASPLGIQDLSGNVEEWTSDWYVENLAVGGGAASGAAHVLRGGGWLSTPSASRVTSRNWGSAIEAGPNVGFRCAKDG